MSSNTRLLIKKAQILLPNGNFLQGDTSIENGKISGIAPEISPRDNDKIVDATGLVLLPGVIDPQVHFREPGLEHKEDLFTASLACGRGGVTSFLKMPNTKPLTTTQATLDDKLQRAASKCLVNYGFFMGATAANLPRFVGSQFQLVVLKFLWILLIEPNFVKGDRLIAVCSEDWS